MGNSLKIPHPLPIEAALDSRVIRRETEWLMAQPDKRLLGRGDFEVLVFCRDEAPSLFHELSRQREITFRHSGQGTGLARDQTPEDGWYRQLVLWDQRQGQIAGAYRLASSTEVIADHGLKGMYLSHMFYFDPMFFSRDSQALELTRSFVAKAYQNDRVALPLLWQGLALLVRRGGVQRLFGAVTLSPDYTDNSRRLMTAWLARFRSYPSGPLAFARQPFPIFHRQVGLVGGKTIDELRPWITDRFGAIKPVPPLLRHYLSLGATFHAFHIEASFNEAIYCLLELEIAGMSPAHARRFMGAELR